MTGAEVVREERLAPETAEALAGLLDVDAEVPTRSGDALPPLWHWVFLLERPRQRDLGPDGHPTSGVPAPPGPGRRRMFAGGRVTTHRPLVLGRPAVRRTRVVDTREKVGRSGPLTFVTVRSEIQQDGALAVVDEQDIVYRAPGSELPPPASGGDRLPEDGRPCLRLDADEALLFRFSALTYNAHRIHYDREFVRTEGYADLVVHGPLQALMMGELFRRTGTSLVGQEYSYRLVAPMVGPQRLTVALADVPADLRADGRTDVPADLRADGRTDVGDGGAGGPAAATFSAAGVVTARSRLRPLG